MKEKDRETLMQTRAQAKLVDSLRERFGREKMTGLKALSMDGMPHTGRSTAGLDVRLIRQEEHARILHREEALLARLEKRARAVMTVLRPELYAFCAMYYVAGMSLCDTGEAIDRSERQCMRYRQEIEGKEKGG